MSGALSKREREVLVLLADGDCTKQVAFRLGLSPRTVETYRKGLVVKLRAKSTAHAVAIAIRTHEIH